MNTTEIAAGVHHLRLGIANAYLIADADGAVLVDTGPAGHAPAIQAALARIGVDRSALHTVVLTHFHDDHAGSCADLADWSGATVLAGAGDAPFIRGDVPGPPPNFTEPERALHRVAAADLSPAPASPVHRELSDGTVLDVAGGAVVLAVPGHTPGSLALHLPERGVLITGDTIAEHQGQVILGPFNLDRDLAWRSLQRLAALDVGTVGFGHGDPVTHDAAHALRAAIDPFGG
ncbi:MBL fold metallo-hydrolase [Kineococcus esterisolvens]|uniref:MBL fold metallo-hydrolase n=1 Tax=unclassified Kineococcus TaxID=2621656 RepID=UPI003D7EA4A6